LQDVYFPRRIFPSRPMTQIIEVFWNAQPHLHRLKIRVRGGPLNPVAERLFNDIRKGIAATFPSDATLVRIATRKADPDANIRVVRNGEAESAKVHASVASIIERSVAAAARSS
jgi:hypothetical protein